MIKRMLKKYKEIILYVVFGVLTTLVNLVCFKIFDALLGERLYLVTNIISWIFAVVFAYVTNKLWVFESKSWKPSIAIKELISFFGARLFSLGVEELGLWLLIDVIGMSSLSFKIFTYELNGNMIAKIIMQVIVVVINYVLSKLFIFRNNKNKSKND